MDHNISEEELYEALWDRTTLVISDEDRNKLRSSTVSINGLGGIGGIVVEELARAGVGGLRLSDPDVFEPTNMGRQLYATTKTLGRNKAEVARERALDINPYCRVEAFTDGIQKDNIHEIFQGVDVIVDEVDVLSRRVLMHRVARDMKIPVVHGCRAGFPGDRWTLQVWTWNYRDHPETESREEEYKLKTCGMSWDELTDDVLKSVDQDVIDNMKHKIRTEIIKGNTVSFGNVSHEYLLSKLDGDTEEPFRDPLLHKRAIFVQAPHTVGIMVSLEAMKLLIGWQNTSYKLNLLKGEAING